MEAFLESKHVSLKDAKELKNDYNFLNTPDHMKNKHKALHIRKQTSTGKDSLNKSFEEKCERILDQDIIDELKKEIIYGFDNVSP